MSSFLEFWEVTSVFERGEFGDDKCWKTEAFPRAYDKDYEKWSAAVIKLLRSGDYWKPTIANPEGSVPVEIRTRRLKAAVVADSERKWSQVSEN